MMSGMWKESYHRFTTTWILATRIFLATRLQGKFLNKKQYISHSECLLGSLLSSSWIPGDLQPPATAPGGHGLIQTWAVQHLHRLTCCGPFVSSVSDQIFAITEFYRLCRKIVGTPHILGDFTVLYSLPLCWE